MACETAWRRTTGVRALRAAVVLATLAAGAPAALADEPGAGPSIANPPDKPAQGLVYRGLQFKTTGPCALAYAVVFTDGCTHGPDEAPAGAVLEDAPPPASDAVTPDVASPQADVQCDGDGVTGKRTQVLYVRASNVASRYAAYLSSFRLWAQDADRIYRQSAAETGGGRHVRFVTNSACLLSIPEVVVPVGATADFGSTISALQSLGYNRTDRKYMLFVDATVYCGIGNIRGDDSPGAANLNNGGPSYGRTDSGCWGGPTAAHEHMHNIGGVQMSAPHSSGGWHCVDEYDRMCYSDTPLFPPMQFLCPASTHDRLFDCNHDDYFHTSPPLGSYLQTHWNAANSQYLVSAPSSLYGYVWADQPTAASYTPSLTYQRNSTGSANTIARSSTGVYRVSFTNLATSGGSGGTVDVTAYGSGGESCKVQGWGSSGADLSATVLCFNAAGASVDTTFTAAFTRPVGSPGRLAYLWAHNPTSASYTPSSTYQFNSTGGTNTVTRSSTGVYQARFAGLGLANGTVKVTAYGGGSNRCKVGSWGASLGDLVATIRCFTVAGAPVDTLYTATFADRTSILGNGQANGYAWIDNPLASSTPSAPYQFDSAGGTISMTRSAVGTYAVAMPGLGSARLSTLGGHAQATAYGSDSASCKVASWSSVFTPTATVNVRCFTAAGVPTDTRFTVQFTR